jgi:hypothetical protein
MDSTDKTLSYKDVVFPQSMEGLATKVRGYRLNRWKETSHAAGIQYTNGTWNLWINDKFGTRLFDYMVAVMIARIDTGNYTSSQKWIQDSTECDDGLFNHAAFLLVPPETFQRLEKSDCAWTIEGVAHRMQVEGNVAKRSYKLYKEKFGKRKSLWQRIRGFGKWVQE